jgi:hypothetical protein
MATDPSAYRTVTSLIVSAAADCKLAGRGINTDHRHAADADLAGLSLWKCVARHESVRVDCKLCSCSHVRIFGLRYSGSAR